MAVRDDWNWVLAQNLGLLQSSFLLWASLKEVSFLCQPEYGPKQYSHTWNVSPSENPEKPTNHGTSIFVNKKARCRILASLEGMPQHAADNYMPTSFRRKDSFLNLCRVFLMISVMQILPRSLVSSCTHPVSLMSWISIMCCGYVQIVQISSDCIMTHSRRVILILGHIYHVYYYLIHVKINCFWSRFFLLRWNKLLGCPGGGSDSWFWLMSSSWGPEMRPASDSMLNTVRLRFFLPLFASLAHALSFCLWNKWIF